MLLSTSPISRYKIKADIFHPRCENLLEGTCDSWHLGGAPIILLKFVVTAILIVKWQKGFWKKIGPLVFSLILLFHDVWSSMAYFGIVIFLKLCVWKLKRTPACQQSKVQDLQNVWYCARAATLRSSATLQFVAFFISYRRCKRKREIERNSNPSIR